MKKSDYQFPGVFSSAVVQKAFYTPDCTQLPQSTANPHYLWDDIQISKSGWNKDREVDVLLSDKTETLMYRIASCNGVKCVLMNHVIMLHQYQLKDPVASTTISSWSKVMTKHLALFSLHICILKNLMLQITDGGYLPL